MDFLDFKKRTKDGSVFSGTTVFTFYPILTIANAAVCH